VWAKKRQALPRYDRVPDSLLYLRLGESLLFDAHFQNALERFDAALALADAPDVIQAMAHLRRGQTLDGLHRRQEARAAYQKTLRLNTDKKSYREAKRYLKKPFVFNR
jgi:tetratricopeptide (TPR) repeat protein